MGVLDGRHALITGGGTGIGAAIATALAGEGAAVSLVGRRKAPLDAVAAQLRKAAAVVADVTKEADTAAMVCITLAVVLFGVFPWVAACFAVAGIVFWVKSKKKDSASTEVER